MIGLCMVLWIFYLLLAILARFTDVKLEDQTVWGFLIIANIWQVGAIVIAATRWRK